MRRIVLIGTSHTFQKSGCNDPNSIRTFVEDICGQYQIVAIGEEMSEEALAQHGATQSLCLQVANSLNIAHRYCDPDNAQRAALYVRQDHDIQAYGFLNGWTPEKIEAEIRSSNAMRERYWLYQLTEMNVWPALFVCGADHVRYFRDLAEKRGFAVIIAANDWEPNAANLSDTV